RSEKRQLLLLLALRAQEPVDPAHGGGRAARQRFLAPHLRRTRAAQKLPRFLGGHGLGHVRAEVQQLAEGKASRHTRAQSRLPPAVAEFQNPAALLRQTKARAVLLYQPQEARRRR